MAKDSRKYDLEELAELYRTAENSFRRDRIKAVINKIMRENGKIEKERQELIRAIRSDDRRHVRFVGERLRKLEKDMTGGRETIVYK